MNLQPPDIEGRSRRAVDALPDPAGSAAASGWRWVRTSLKALLPLIVVAAGFAAYSYLKATKPEKPARPITERVYAVKTVVARPETVQPKLTLYGSTVAGRQTDIRALVSGRVIETSPKLREGGQLAKGDMLLQIDPFNYENAVTEAKALLAEAKARVNEFEASIQTERSSLAFLKQQIKLAKTDVQRATPLARRGTVSQRTVDERQQTLLQRQQSAKLSENTIKVWEARVAQQKAVIERLQSALALAERRLSETRLEAPFDAYVRDVTSQVGRLVGANDKIATLIDRNWIEARFTLNDEQFGRIIDDSGTPVGRKLNVVWRLGDKTLEYDATIDRVGAEVNASSGGVEVFARIDNPHDKVALRPGAFVTITVPDRAFKDVYRLPSAALYAGNTVYVVVDGRLQSRTVDVVGGIEDDMLVTGELGTGQRILSSRISTPGDGVRVKEVKQ